MKKSFLLLALCTLGFAAMAQETEEEDREKKRFFKKENLFTGGGVAVSFFSGGTLLGASPFFGYSINRFVDVAASLNFNYVTQRDVVLVGDRVRSTYVGPGAFMRLYPLPFLFAQAQYEHNYITQRYRPAPGSGYIPETIKTDVGSVLVGGGYCSGRQGHRSNFFYVSILWDVTKDPLSPFTDNLNRAIPIVRTGFQIALFQGRRRTMLD
jgi:hypothetical protein